MRRVVLSLLAGTLLSVAGICDGRPVRIPTLEELWGEAQVVAIIRPLWATNAPDQLTSAGPLYGPRDPKLFQALNTQFHVSVVLKQPEDSKPSIPKVITLLHFRPVIPEVNGGLFMFFEFPEGSHAPVGGGGGEYLAFLKRQPDGRYVPITGNYDSELSFCKLVKPMFEVMRYFQEDGRFKTQQKTNGPASPVQTETPAAPTQSRTNQGAEPSSPN